MTAVLSPFTVIGVVDMEALFNPPPPTLEYRTRHRVGPWAESDGKPATIVKQCGHSVLPETRGEPMYWVQVGRYEFAAYASELFTIGPKFGDCDFCGARCQSLKPHTIGWVCCEVPS